MHVCVLRNMLATTAYYVVINCLLPSIPYLNQCSVFYTTLRRLVQQPGSTGARLPYLRYPPCAISTAVRQAWLVKISVRYSHKEARTCVV